MALSNYTNINRGGHWYPDIRYPANSVSVAALEIGERAWVPRVCLKGQLVTSTCVKVPCGLINCYQFVIELREYLFIYWQRGQNQRRGARLQVKFSLSTDNELFRFLKIEFNSYTYICIDQACRNPGMLESRILARSDSGHICRKLFCIFFNNLLNSPAFLGFCEPGVDSLKKKNWWFFFKFRI